MSVDKVLQAITVLKPLVDEVVEYLSGGPEPKFMATLPDRLKSEIALAARKAKLK
jgi:hypothetical protein